MTKYPDMRPSKGAGRPSYLAMNPGNREASAARRARMLEAFDSLDENTRADLLELTETIASTAGEQRYERTEAHAIVQQIYAAAGL